MNDFRKDQIMDDAELDELYERAEQQQAEEWDCTGGVMRWQNLLAGLVLLAMVVGVAYLFWTRI